MRMQARGYLIGREPKTTKKGQEYMLGRFSDDMGKSIEVQAWNDQEKNVLKSGKMHQPYDVALDFQKNGNYTAFNLVAMKSVSA